MMDFKEHALGYFSRGFSVIPVKGKKPRMKSWRPYQETPMSPAEIARRFSSPHVTGVAVILGKVSGNLCCRDFDSHVAYPAWAAESPDYASTLPTARTARGLHVYFRATGQSTRKLGDGELRGQGGYCLLPPSRHPNGIIYQWLRDPPAEIPTIDPIAAGFVKTWANETQSKSIQRDRVPEVQRDRRIRDTDVIMCKSKVFGESNDSACEIRSIEEAVRVSLPSQPHDNHHWLFTLARALLAFQKYRREQKELQFTESLSNDSLRTAFDLWHSLASPNLRPGQTKDEYFMEFLTAWAGAKVPLGESNFKAIWEATKEVEMPAVASQFSDQRLIRLVSFCRELQRGSGNQPFFLAVRTVQRLFELSSPRTAQQWLKGFQQLRIIEPAEKGGPETNRATRFRYLPPLD